MKRVLVPIDFSENSMLALKHGIVIANKLQANLRIVHVKTGNSYAPEFGRDEIDLRINNRIENWMEFIFSKYQDKYTVTNGKFDFKVREGHVVQQLVNQAHYDDTTLIVIGSHGASGFTDRWIGSNAFRLVVDAPCPVLVMRPNMSFDSSFSRILIPVNLRKSSRRKLPVVAGVAKLFNAKVCLVGIRQTNLKYIFSQLLATLRQVENYLVNSAGLTIESKTTLTGGDLSKKLIDYATEVGADMMSVDVVVNSGRLTEKFRPFLNDIINKAKCPVLAIPIKE